MILDSINISSYELNFKKQYINAKFKLSNRKGWIIQLTSNGFTGYGDCSPLEKFSIETLDQCAYALEGFKLSLGLIMISILMNYFIYPRFMERAFHRYNLQLIAPYMIYFLN